MTATDQQCTKCKERICLVRYNGLTFSRPHRMSKCREYSKTYPRRASTCRSESFERDDEALAMFPITTAAIDATSQEPK